MGEVIRRIYELQNIGKGIINSLTIDNLLSIRPESQGLQDVLRVNSILDVGNIITVNQQLSIRANNGGDGANITGIHISDDSYASNIIPNARIGKGIGNNTTDVSLNFFPTQAIFRDSLNSKGLEYFGDYEANFTDKSLITRKFLEDTVDGSQTKINAGTNISVIGNGTIDTPYIISNSQVIDGSETKINAGTNVSVSGSGTIGAPYIINSTGGDGSETKIVAGSGTTVSGNGTIATPYQIDIPKNNVINSGFFAGLNVGSVSSLTVGGDITAAVTTLGVAPDSIITVTMANAMSNTNYTVDIKLQGQSADLNDDNDVATPVFKPISTTQFQIGLRELANKTQSLKVHIQVIEG